MTAAPSAATALAAADAPSAGSDDVLLRLDHVHTYYGHIHALQGVSLEVRRGEIVTLIGANGAGKTTTLKTISGLLHPREGTVWFEGKDISRTAAHQLVRSGIGHSPEGRRIFSRLTVLENLKMGAFTRPQNDIEGDLDHIFELFPRLRERTSQRGGSLSGGEQQMLAIARGLMSVPVVLMIDELSLGLAPVIVQQLVATLKALKQTGVTLLLVEQNVNLALSISNYAYVIAEGRIFTEGVSEQVAAMPDVRKAYLGF